LASTSSPEKSTTNKESAFSFPSCGPVSNITSSGREDSGATSISISEPWSLLIMSVEFCSHLPWPFTSGFISLELGFKTSKLHYSLYSLDLMSRIGFFVGPMEGPFGKPNKDLPDFIYSFCFFSCFLFLPNLSFIYRFFSISL
jgi:hypothetical protein